MNDTTSGPDFTPASSSFCAGSNRIHSPMATRPPASERAKAVEPVLKAFEYLPRDLSRRPGSLSGIPVASRTLSQHRTCRPPTDRRSIAIMCPPKTPGWSNACAARRHDLRQNGVDRIRLASSRSDHQSRGMRAYAGRLVIRLRRGGCGRHRAAGPGNADAGLGDPARGVQWRRRPQAEFRRDPAHRRASAQSLARSCRLLRAARGRCGPWRCRCLRPPATSIRRSAASRLRCRSRPRRAAAGKAASSDHAASEMAEGRAEQQKVFETAIAKLREAGAVVEEHEWAELDTRQLEYDQHHPCERGVAIFGDLVERYPDRTSNHLKTLVRPEKQRLPWIISPPDRSRRKLRIATCPAIVGFDAILTVPAFGEAPGGLGYHRQGGILRAMDPDRSARNLVAGGIRQEPSAARHPAGRRLSARPAATLGRQMGRRCLRFDPGLPKFQPGHAAMEKKDDA